MNSVNYQDSVLGINCSTCNKVNTRTKQSIVSGLKDVLAIQLLIFTHDEFGRQRKFSPDLVIDQEITCIDKYKLKAIIWHHGTEIQSGHYTVMIKQSNNQWIHISDANTHDYPVKFSCSKNDTMVPYICFYTKDDTDVSNAPIELESVTVNNDPLNTHIDDLSEHVDFFINDEMNHTCASSDDSLDYSERMKLVVRTIHSML